MNNEPELRNSGDVLMVYPKIQLFRQSFSINSVFGQVPHDFLCPKSVFMFTR